MQLTKFRVHNFRNHLDTLLEFGDGVNVLVGDNGQGKTNIIEAISYLCLTKSFFAGGDAMVINFNQELFEVEGTFVSETGTTSDVRVAYDRQMAEKAYFINRKSLEPLSSVIGKFPVVICSPEHAPITSGSPMERRKFVDFVVSQSNPLYFQTLIGYRRALKQRNKVLFESRTVSDDIRSLLEPWEDQLSEMGGELMRRREEFVKEFGSYIQAAYRQIVGSGEEPKITYRPSVERPGPDAGGDCAGLLRESFQIRRSEELRVGTTLVGPHRDEFSLTINGLDLRKFASQGQHKTFLVALKLAEFYYLKERCGEKPLLLLDDVFSELDKHRSEKLLDCVEHVSQTFVTSTAPDVFEKAIDFGGANRKFMVHDGKVLDQKPVPFP